MQNSQKIACLKKTLFVVLRFIEICQRYNYVHSSKFWLQIGSCQIFDFLRGRKTLISVNYLVCLCPLDQLFSTFSGSSPGKIFFEVFCPRVYLFCGQFVPVKKIYMPYNMRNT